MPIVKQSGTTGDRDNRTGLASVVQSYVVDTLAEAMQCGRDDVPLGLVEVRRPFSSYKNHPTKLLVNVQYEGTMDDEPGEDAGHYEFDVVLEENPIEAHPKIDELRKRFNGTVDPNTKRVHFDIEAPSNNQSGGSALSKTAAKSAKNPLYGLTSFLTLGSIFRRTIVLKTVPSDLLDRVGTIRQSLPKGFPTPEGRVWLVMPPRMVTRGNGYELAEEWKLIRDEPGIRVVYSMLHDS